MEWIKTKDRLPEEHHNVLVIRNLPLDEYNINFQTYEIGHIEGNRWKLDSQMWCALPCTPTIDSGIISHWMELPEKP